MASGVGSSFFLSNCIDNGRLSLRDLILCFETCRGWKRELQNRGFSFGIAKIILALTAGRDPLSIVHKLRKLEPARAQTRLDHADQVVRFLLQNQYGQGTVLDAPETLEHESVSDAPDTRRHGSVSNAPETREREWAQLAYQEPDGSYLSSGIKAMRWIWHGKGALMHQRCGKPWYHCCVALFKHVTS